MHQTGASDRKVSRAQTGVTDTEFNVANRCYTDPGFNAVTTCWLFRNSMQQTDVKDLRSIVGNYNAFWS